MIYVRFSQTWSHLIYNCVLMYITVCTIIHKLKECFVYRGDEFIDTISTTCNVTLNVRCTVSEAFWNYVCISYVYIAIIYFTLIDPPL